MQTGFLFDLAMATKHGTCNKYSNYTLTSTNESLPNMKRSLGVVCIKPNYKHKMNRLTIDLMEKKLPFLPAHPPHPIRPQYQLIFSSNIQSYLILVRNPLNANLFLWLDVVHMIFIVWFDLWMFVLMLTYYLNNSEVEKELCELMGQEE